MGRKATNLCALSQRSYKRIFVAVALLVRYYTARIEIKTVKKKTEKKLILLRDKVESKTKSAEMRDFK